MKKYLILTLVLSMLLSACSEKEEASVSEPEKSTIATESVAESLAEESSDEENGNESSTESSVSSDEDLEISDDPFNEESNIDFAEGKRLWNEFLKVAQPLKSDSSQYSKFISRADDYIDNHADITEDDKAKYYETPDFDRIIGYSVYIKPRDMIKRVSDPTNNKIWNSNVTTLYDYESYCSDEIADAYKSLMGWSYLYFVETNKVFNFIEEFGIESSVEEGDTAELADAKALWNRYLSVFNVIEADANYKRILDFADKASCAKQYADVTGNTKAEYENMTAYNKFLWTVTYVAPAYYSNTLSNVNYTTWRDSPISASERYLEANDATTEMTAVHSELLEWSYNYYAKHGNVFNFIEEFGIV